jgi:hypothetical protein
MMNKNEWIDSSIEKNEPSRGLGDSVSKFIKKATGGRIKECEPCRKRREALNKKLPYKEKS